LRHRITLIGVGFDDIAVLVQYFTSFL